MDVLHAGVLEGVPEVGVGEPGDRDRDLAPAERDRDFADGTDYFAGLVALDLPEGGPRLRAPLLEAHRLPSRPRWTQLTRSRWH